MPTYLLTWNPDKWHWADIQECVDKAKREGSFLTRWSCGLSKGIERGDRVFILRQGAEPRGIFGSGHAISGVFEDDHWAEEKVAQGKPARYIRVNFDTLLNPEAEPILPREWLGRGALVRMHWSTQISGILIPDDVAAALEEEWEGFLATRGSTLFAGAERPEEGEEETPMVEGRRKGEGRIFGHVPGYPEGSVFESRAELSAAGVHRPTQAGISGSGGEGADSIVLSGGYEDDQDLGDVIIYTGHGGRDQASGKQVADQTLTLQNLALAKNKTLGLPVRVIRGGKHRSPFGPESGYRYDGLFSVDDYWHERGRSGFRVWRYRLVKIKDDAAPPQTAEPSQGQLLDDGGGRQPARRETTTLRIVRDTKKAREVKKLYDFTCQMCGVRLEGPAGPYAEAAHIRPLGAPHDGPDSTENLLCLCPNHHVLFDLGGVTIADDFTLIGAAAGRLTVHPRHRISTEHVRYHREHYLVRE